MKKILALSFVSALLMNTLSALPVDEQVRDAFENAVATGSAVAGFFSVYTLPFAAMGNVFSRSFPLCDMLKKPVKPEKDTKKAKNTADFALLNALETGARALVKDGGFCTGGLAAFARLFAAWNYHASRPPGAQEEFFVLFLLMFLVVLARGNLPGAERYAFVVRKKSPIPLMRNRVFYWCAP